MTETDTTPEGSPEPQDTTASTPAEAPVTDPVTEDPQEADTGPQDDPLRRANAEAAQRRRQLREVESERDALRERVDTHDRETVERIASRSLADPSDTWIVATNLDELRDDDGALDPELVKAQITDALDRKPHWRRVPDPPPDLHAGVRPIVEAGPSFGAALKGRR